MRFIPRKTVHQQIIDFLSRATVHTVSAIVLNAEEFNEIHDSPRGSTSYDPLGQFKIELHGTRLRVAGLPVYQEGEPECPT